MGPVRTGYRLGLSWDASTSVLYALLITSITSVVKSPRAAGGGCPSRSEGLGPFFGVAGLGVLVRARMWRLACFAGSMNVSVTSNFLCSMTKPKASACP